MATTKNYPLTEEEFNSLTTTLIENYPVESFADDFVKIDRPNGHLLLVKNPDRKLMLVSNDENGLGELLKELKEKVSFQIH